MTVSEAGKSSTLLAAGCTLLLLLSFAGYASAQSSDDPHITPRGANHEVTIAAGSPPASLTPRPMRVDVNLVLVPVTVTDSLSHPVVNLSKDDFLLYEAAKPQQIRYFSSEDAPMSVAVVLDYSASMKNKIEYERQAVEEFFSNANPADEYFAIASRASPNYSQPRLRPSRRLRSNWPPSSPMAALHSSTPSISACSSFGARTTSAKPCW